MDFKKLIFASDYRGIKLRLELLEYARKQNLIVEDLGIEEGSSLDYIDISKKITSRLYNTNALGILICGSGQGVTIAANRSNHIRATLCRTPEDALSARSKLNANIMSLGSKDTSLEQAIDCFNVFINTPFKGGKHEKSSQKLNVSGTHHKDNGINLIVRAIITHQDHILLTTTTENNTEFASNLYFLPGGHVDHNESAKNALKREIQEEMGISAEILQFLGCLECSWNRKGNIYHEINLVYSVEIKDLDINFPPQPTEPFHKFVWCPLSKIKNYTILPQKLQVLIESVALGHQNQNFYSQMINNI